MSSPTSAHHLTETLSALTISRLHQLLLGGHTTAAEVVSHYLRRIAATNTSGPNLRAVVAVNPAALAEAEALDTQFTRTGRFSGPLHAVPVLVKDQAETAGLRTAFGSALFADYVPTVDASVVARLRAAGAIVLAKTAMCDLAAGWFSSSSLSGHTRNPHALDRDSGGSSAGTGAGIAAELGLVGVGEDTGGSIRVPSAFCGLYGLRPTTGLVSRAGFSPLVHFQDTPGPMGRTVADVAALLQVLAGWDPADPLTAIAHTRARGTNYGEALKDATFSGARVGVLRSSFGFEGQAHAISAGVLAALRAMGVAGATVRDGLELADQARWISRTSLYTAQSPSDLAGFMSARPELAADSFDDVYRSGVFHPENDLFHDIASGPAAPEQDPSYWSRRTQQSQLRIQLLALMAASDVDVLAHPTVQVPAPTHQDLASGRWSCLTFPTNTVLASQSGLPAINIPVGKTSDGVPIGMELIGAPLAEPLLLRLAAAWEAQHTPWTAPDLVGGPADESAVRALLDQWRLDPEDAA